MRVALVHDYLTQYGGAERVLVAGNGTVVSLAAEIFRDASEIVLVSNEGPVLEAAGRSGESDARSRPVYLGILGDRAAIGELLARHRPASVFAHFGFGHVSVENMVGAYVRTVLAPLLALADAVHAHEEIRIYVIHEGPGESSGILDRARISLERMLRSRFGDAPARLSILRTGLVRPAGWWGMVLSDLIRHGEGVSRLALHRESALRYGRTGTIIERIDADPPCPPELLERMTDLLDRRDERGILTLLDEAERTSTEEHHE